MACVVQAVRMTFVVAKLVATAFYEKRKVLPSLSCQEVQYDSKVMHEPVKAAMYNIISYNASPLENFTLICLIQYEYYKDEVP